MPDAAAKDHPVLAHFRQKDPETGKSQTYDPNGDDVDNGGWPGAKSTWSGDPNSDEAKELLAGLDHNGPLIGKPEADDKPKATSSRSTTAKPADSKES